MPKVNSNKHEQLYSGEVFYWDNIHNYQESTDFYAVQDTDEDKEPVSDGYDDYNGFYKVTLSSTNPKKYINKYPKDEFNGSKWKPKKFIQMMYLRNIYNLAKRFIDDLDDIDLKDVPAKKTIQTQLKDAKLLLRKAMRSYEIDQINTLMYLLESIEKGRKIVERLRLYDIQKKLGD